MTGDDEWQGSLDDFSRHEVLHTASIIASMFEDFIAEHRFTKSKPVLKGLADRLTDGLNDFYQQVGQIDEIERGEVPPPDLADSWRLGLHAVVRDFGRRRLDELARSVRHRLRAMPATGIHGQDDASNVWHEYRFEVRHGPTPTLEYAWDLTIRQIIDPLLDGLAGDEATIISVAASWEVDGDQSDLASEPAISTDLMHRAIRSRLEELADD